jgi:hypothetical protein
LSLEILERRRALVLRSAKLQRATIAIRLNRIEARPLTTLAEASLRLLRTPWARRVAILAVGMAFTRLRRKPQAKARS